MRPLPRAMKVGTRDLGDAGMVQGLSESGGWATWRGGVHQEHLVASPP